MNENEKNDAFSDATDAVTTNGDSSANSQKPTPTPSNAANSSTQPNFQAPPIRTRPHFQIPYSPNAFPPPTPRPLGFWQILLKDLATTLVGVGFFCFLAFFFIFVALCAFGSALNGGSSMSLVSETELSGSDISEGKIAIIPITGLIETNETGFLTEAIDLVRADDRIRGIVLRINSPGGTISGSDYYYNLLKEVKNELNVPVVVSMGDVAASGGYYLATLGDEIFAERSTATGSIGVIIPMYDASALCEKLGVGSTPVVSGPMKGMGDFMKKPSEEEIAIFQGLVDESYEQFLDVVREGRPWFRETETFPERETELRKIADGRVYTAKQAKELHLIDEIGFLDDAVDAALKRAGLTENSAQVIRFDETLGFFDSLGLASARSSDKKIDAALQGLTALKGYYLCPRVLPLGN